MAKPLKNPPTKTVVCRFCKRFFEATGIEDWELHQTKPDVFQGYIFARHCKKCSDELNQLPRDSKEYGQHLYDEGFITEQELRDNYK